MSKLTCWTMNIRTAVTKYMAVSITITVSIAGLTLCSRWTTCRGISNTGTGSCQSGLKDSLGCCQGHYHGHNTQCHRSHGKILPGSHFCNSVGILLRANSTKINIALATVTVIVNVFAAWFKVTVVSQCPIWLQLPGWLNKRLCKGDCLLRRCYEICSVILTDWCQNFAKSVEEKEDHSCMCILI